VFLQLKSFLFPGTILGITNGFGTIPGWLAPLMAASFTEEEVHNYLTFGLKVKKGKIK
jgi:hypothetical protein